MEGDGLALTIRIGRQNHGCGFLRPSPNVVENGLLSANRHVLGLETTLHIDAELLGRQVAHMADRGHDIVTAAKVLADGTRLGRGLHNDQGLSVLGGRHESDLHLV